MKYNIFFFIVLVTFCGKLAAQINSITLKVEYLERKKNRNDSATLHLKYVKQQEFTQAEVALYIINDSSYYTYNIYQTAKKTYSGVLDSNSLDPKIAMQKEVFSMELNKASVMKDCNTIYTKKLNAAVFDINNYTYSSAGFKKYFMTDTVEKIQWKLQDETKKIDSFTCQKATGKFRGRVWEAWFTSQVPVDAGPWKLSGLPGLILEAADTSGLYSFVCKTIQMPAKDINKGELLVNRRVEKVSVRKWAGIQYNMFKTHNEEIKAIFDSLDKMIPAYTNPEADERLHIGRLDIKEPYRPIEIF